MFDTTTAEDFFGESYDFDHTMITNVEQIEAFVNEMREGADYLVEKRTLYRDGVTRTRISARKEIGEGIYRVADITLIDGSADKRAATSAFIGQMNDQESAEFIFEAEGAA